MALLRAVLTPPENAAVSVLPLRQGIAPPRDCSPDAVRDNKEHMSYERELQVALEAAGRARQLLLEEYEQFPAIPDAPADITTAADRKAQEVILHCLQAVFPEDAYCAEEQTAALAGRPAVGSRLWIVDPIDGTRGFARKNGEFATLIAFVEAGRLVLGVVEEPVLGRRTYAVRGQGCWRQDAGATAPLRCQVSGTRDLAQAILTQSHLAPTERQWTLVQALAPRQVRETYSTGRKLAQVARGEADLYLNTYPCFHDWDSAAGHLLVEEAGGQVTGLRGEALVYGLPGAAQRAGLLASNGLLHAHALARLRPLL
jgi:3'(2'), 5'-bisphosphate nucleotidase